MRKLSPEELEASIEQHGLWLESDGVRGTRADFTGVNLQGADLRCADLRGAKLDGGIVGAWKILGAHFTLDALPWLMLRPNWAKERAHVHIY
jgi:uncharacterized protein YjbI with pentapeptide repeats